MSELPISELPGEAVILALESSAEQASAAILHADGQRWQEIHAARHGHGWVVSEMVIYQRNNILAVSNHKCIKFCCPAWV